MVSFDDWKTRLRQCGSRFPLRKGICADAGVRGWIIENVRTIGDEGIVVPRGWRESLLQAIQTNIIRTSGK
jgi:hypothetical protein